MPRLNKTAGALATIATLGLGGLGADISIADIELIPEKTYEIREQVKQKQVGNVVEVEMPWKGEKGLTIKKDLGERTAKERIDDKRKQQALIEEVDYGDGGIKFDLILNEKPDTNVFCQQIEGWEEYNFYRQPPLWEEQGLDAPTETCTDTECDTDGDGIIDSERPLEIVNGYVIYHKEKRDHIVGQTNYETGKFGDIPYPEIWELEDESTKHRAESFDITDGEMCVTVSEDWLKKAKYPVRIDPTFGYTTVGGTEFSFLNANQLFGLKGTPTSSGDVSKITAYTRVASGTTNAKGVLVNPSSLLIITNGVSDSSGVTGTSGAWRDFTYTTEPSVVGSTEYAVSIIPDGNLRIWYDDLGGTPAYKDNTNSYSSPTDPTDAVFNSVATISIYATYTAPTYNISTINGVDICDISTWNGTALSSISTWNDIGFKTCASGPKNGQAAFVADYDPSIYWELNSTNLGTNYGDDTTGNDDNTAVAGGDISTQDSYEGMNNQNDDGQNSWFDTETITDAAMLIYIPAGMSHGTNYGLFHNGGGTNAQGAFARATTTGVELACAHNNGGDTGDYLIEEIPDASLPGWFAFSCQYSSYGGTQGDMALWLNGVAERSGTRVYQLAYGSGDPDFGDNSGREPNAAEVLDPASYTGGDWGGNTAIDSSGILIANFTEDNATHTNTNPPGNGDTWHEDYYTYHFD